MLVNGNQLSDTTKQAVLRAFVHRWTIEAGNGDCPACRAVKFPYITGQALPSGPVVHTRESWHAYHAPVITDAEWIADHAFYVKKDGSLDARYGHCEPAFLAE